MRTTLDNLIWTNSREDKIQEEKVKILHLQRTLSSLQRLNNSSVSRDFGVCRFVNGHNFVELFREN